MDPEVWPDSANLAFAEELFSSYLSDPASVPESWSAWFADISRGDAFAQRPALGPRFEPPRLFAARNGRGAVAPPPTETALQDRVNQLVRAHHVRGHMIAELDPLGRPRTPQPELEPSFYGLGEEDLDRAVQVESVESFGGGTLRELMAHLRNTYCRRIGVQFMHIDELHGEAVAAGAHGGDREPACQLSAGTEQIHILTQPHGRGRSSSSSSQKKYLGAKRFSLEGCREPDSAAGPGRGEGRADRASRRLSSAWPTAAASTCCANVTGQAARRRSSSEFEDAQSGVPGVAAVT